MRSASPLTVTANNATKVAGQTNPPFTASYSGFVNGESPSALGGALSSYEVLWRDYYRLVTEPGRNLPPVSRDHPFVALLEAAQAATWGWDMETNALEWDAAMFSIFGVEPDSFTPTYSRFLDLVHPEDRQATDGNVREAVERVRAACS